MANLNKNSDINLVLGNMIISEPGPVTLLVRFMYTLVYAFIFYFKSFSFRAVKSNWNQSNAENNKQMDFVGYIMI